jgi:hypothetical protein
MVDNFVKVDGKMVSAASGQQHAALLASLKEDYKNKALQLHTKCTSKQHEQDQTQCLQGLKIVANLALLKDKEAIIFELKHGGTLASRLKAAKK